MLKTDFSE